MIYGVSAKMPLVASFIFSTDVGQQTTRTVAVNFNDFDSTLISFDGASLPSQLQGGNNCSPLGAKSGTRQLTKTTVTSSHGLVLHAQLLQTSTPATYGRQQHILFCVEGY